MRDARFEAWERALDALEAAATAPAGTLAPWAPPTDLGALPATLHERALRVLELQERALRTLGDLQAEAADHLGALRAVPALRPGGASVYLDVTG